jgi:hypothetical protein
VEVDMTDRDVEEMLETLAMRQQVFQHIKAAQFSLAIMVTEAEETMRQNGERMLAAEIDQVISRLKNASYILRQLEK